MRYTPSTSKKRSSPGNGSSKDSTNPKYPEIKQVWYLLYSIVNACRKFEPYKIKSGNLTTNHIVLNQHGHVKVKNQLTEPEENLSPLPNFYSTASSSQVPKN